MGTYIGGVRAAQVHATAARRGETGRAAAAGTNAPGPAVGAGSGPHVAKLIEIGIQTDLETAVESGVKAAIEPMFELVCRALLPWPRCSMASSPSRCSNVRLLPRSPCVFCAGPHD